MMDYKQTDSSNITKREIPYKKAQLAKTKKLQTTLQRICDDDNNNSSGNERQHLSIDSPSSEGDSCDTSELLDAAKKSYLESDDHVHNKKNSTDRNSGRQDLRIAKSYIIPTEEIPNVNIQRSRNSLSNKSIPKSYKNSKTVSRTPVENRMISAGDDRSGEPLDTNPSNVYQNTAGARLPLVEGDSHKDHTKPPDLKLQITNILNRLTQMLPTFQLHINHVKEKYMTEEAMSDSDIGNVAFILNCVLGTFGEELHDYRNSLSKIYEQWGERYKSAGGVSKERSEGTRRKSIASEDSRIADCSSDTDHAYSLKTSRKTPLKVLITNSRNKSATTINTTQNATPNGTESCSPVEEDSPFSLETDNEPTENISIEPEIAAHEELGPKVTTKSVSGAKHDQQMKRPEKIPKRFSDTLGVLLNEVTTPRKAQNDGYDSDVNSTCSTIVLCRSKANRNRKYASITGDETAKSVKASSEREATSLDSDSSVEHSPRSKTPTPRKCKRLPACRVYSSSEDISVRSDETDSEIDIARSLSNNSQETFNMRSTDITLSSDEHNSDSDDEFIPFREPSLPINSTPKCTRSNSVSGKLRNLKTMYEKCKRAHSSTDDKLQMNCRVLIKKFKV